MITKLRSPILCAIIVLSIFSSVPAVDCNTNGIEDSQDVAAETSLDCNGNGIPDECDVTAVSIGFSEPRSFPTTIDSFASPGQAVLGDFDGDDDIDLVVLHREPSGEQTTSVTLLRNLGDGSFEPPELVTNGRFLTVMVSADLDVDGDLDLVISFARDRIVHTFMNQGDGTFERGNSFLQGRQVTQLAIADFDNDGDADIATTGIVKLVVLANQDSVDFSSVMYEHEFGVETLPDGGPTIAADIDTDGFVDLLVPNHVTESYWLFRNDRGVIQPPEVLDVLTFAHLVPGDLDGDGDIDLVARLSLLFNDGRAVFEPPVELNVQSGGVRSVEDIDGDGDLDLLVTTEQTVLILRNDGGSGSFTRSVEVPLRDSPAWLSAADVDGDGDNDLLALSDSRNEVSEVSVHLQLDDGVRERADVNRNGIPDSCEPSCFSEDVEEIPSECAPALFLRGDCTSDGSVNLTDAICILGRLFGGKEEAQCMTALNANGDVEVNLTDAVFVLGFLFGSGPAPVEPFPECGAGNEADRELGCDSPTDCR